MRWALPVTLQLCRYAGHLHYCAPGLLRKPALRNSECIDNAVDGLGWQDAIAWYLNTEFRCVPAAAPISADFVGPGQP
jgi:hypothetical protein